MGIYNSYGADNMTDGLEVITLETPVNMRMMKLSTGETVLQTAHIVGGPGVAQYIEWRDIPVVDELDLPNT